jgi:hypothetical protein
MKTKQTAVEWGIEKLASLTFDYMAGFISKREYDQLSKGVIKQAKEKEEVRLISAQMDMFHFLNNLKPEMKYLEKRELAEKFAKQYYNETYGGNK